MPAPRDAVFRGATVIGPKSPAPHMDAPADTAQTRASVFRSWHPTVALCYFGAVLVLTMSAFQPVCIALSLVSGLAYNTYLRSWREVVRSLRWQLPLVALVALLNPIFSPLGSTELLTIAEHTIYLESLAFGLCMGGMLVSTLLWFSNAAHVITTDRIMALLGNLMPTVALVISMVARLVPRLITQGRLIGQTMRACKGTGARQAGNRVNTLARLSSVLMGWSLENSLETADAMRGRGWGSAGTRSTYRRFELGNADIAVLVCLAALITLDTVLADTATSQFGFYPTMSTLVTWWGYAPHALLLLAGLAAELAERARWARLEQSR